MARQRFLCFSTPAPLLAKTVARSALLLALCFPTSAFADAGLAESDSKGPIQPWTADDLLLAEGIAETLLSDDGTLAVWTRTGFQALGDGEEGPIEQRKVAHIFLARLPALQEPGSGGIKPIQLTHGIEQASGLALSPDSRHLAFLSKREQPGKKELEGLQVWILPLTGGEARPLTSEKRGVSAVFWVDDKSLLVQREEDPGARAQHLKVIKDDSIAVEDVRDNSPVRLFLTTLDGKARRLGANEDWIEQVAVAPDGMNAVITAGQSLSFQFDSKQPPRTFLLDPTTGSRHEILAGLNLQPRDFQWSSDSKSFFFVDDRSDHPVYRNATVTELHRFDVESGKATKLEHGWQRGLGRGFNLVPGGVITLLADGARYRPARLLGDPKVERRDLEGEHIEQIDRLLVSRNGSRALYLSSTADRAPQLYAAELSGYALVKAQRLGELNASFVKRPAGRTEIVRWQGAEGDEVEGVLSYPFDYEPGKRYPLVLDIHGGPTGFDRNSWDANWGSPTPLWRQRGAFVFRVNYHGSGNYGLDWAASIRERYYELEIPDIESGVDWLIERGLVDPDRLATSGWSNGGILSASLITHTDRYKAAIIGAADVEWISDWANVDFGATFDNYYFGGPPWERLDHYIEKSPFFKLPEVTTPSLVHTGTEDLNVPPHQSWSIFRVMQQVGKAEVRLLLYPGEPHGLRQLEHQRRKLEEDLAWLDRHLFKTWREKPLALPKGSPLEAAFARAQAARELDGFGVKVADHLVPEGIEYAGLVVGRFEVTRAQWSAYMEATGSEAPRPPRHEADLPARGMSFEQAKIYVAWLAKITGQRWRLPSIVEAKRLAGKGGNSLEAWLEYEANPDDLKSIRRLLEESPVDLLKPVGSHAGAHSLRRQDGLRDAPMVFDLDGNVAEWAQAAGDQGEAIGPSAERPAASKDQPTLGYTGLRVVRDL